MYRIENGFWDSQLTDLVYTYYFKWGFNYISLLPFNYDAISATLDTPSYWYSMGLIRII
jgi:hypothetical protein